jgi:hypothetical protein
VSAVRRALQIERDEQRVPSNLCVVLRYGGLIPRHTDAFSVLVDSICPALAGQARQADPYVISKRYSLIVWLTPSDLSVGSALGKKSGAAIKLSNFQNNARLAQRLQ